MVSILYFLFLSLLNLLYFSLLSYYFTCLHFLTCFNVLFLSGISFFLLVTNFFLFLLTSFSCHCKAPELPCVWIELYKSTRLAKWTSRCKKSGTFFARFQEIWLILLKDHAVILKKSLCEGKDLHWLILLCLTKVNTLTIFVFITERTNWT